jgi:hypothetical protein
LFSVPILKNLNITHIMVFSQYFVDVLKMPLASFTKPLNVA